MRLARDALRVERQHQQAMLSSSSGSHWFSSTYWAFRWRSRMAGLMRPRPERLVRHAEMRASAAPIWCRRMP